MSLKDELDESVDKIVRTDLKIRSGRVVPQTTDFNLSNEGIKLDAVYMYVDLVGSTKLEVEHTEETVAKALKVFLATVTKVLRKHDGEIRSFDGDRVMAIFIGEDKCARAVRAAWTIRWALKNIAYEKLWMHREDIFKDQWQMKAGIGIDTGYALLIRGGVPNNNDIVSIGYAPNIAAKLSDIRNRDVTYITEDVWDQLPFGLKYKKRAGGVEPMWSNARYMDVGGRMAQVRDSSFWMTLS